LLSGTGGSRLGCTHGQNGGVGFEKETCLFFFKQQKKKDKELGLGIQIQP